MRSPRERRRLLWVLAGGRLIGAAGALVTFTFFTLYLRRDFHLPMAALGAVAALLSVGAVAGTFLGGWGSDRLGRRPALLLTLAAEALVLAGLAVFHNPMLATLCGVVLGAADGALWPTFGAAVADLLPPADRQGGYALLGAAVNAGAALGPAVGGALLPLGFGRLFLISGAGVALAAAALARWLPETRPERPPGPSSGRGGDYRVVVRDRAVAAIVLLLLPSLSVMGLLFSFFPLAAAATPGVGARGFGLLFALWGAVIAVLQVPVSQLTRRVRPTVALAVGSATLGLAFFPIALWPGVAGFTVGVVGLAFGEMLSSPPLGSLVANLAPPAARARYQSMIGLAWSVGGVVGPAAAGLVYGRIPGEVFWLAAGLLALLPSPLFPLGPGRTTRVRRAEALAQTEAEPAP